jgi:hypothetical protein
MRHLQGARTMLVGFLITLVLAAGGMMVAHAEKNTEALAADHVILMLTDFFRRGRAGA